MFAGAYTVSIAQWTLQLSVGFIRVCVVRSTHFMGAFGEAQGYLGEKFIYRQKWVFRFPFFKVFTINLDGNSKKSYFLNLSFLIKNFNRGLNGVTKF